MQQYRLTLMHGHDVKGIVNFFLSHLFIMLVSYQRVALFYVLPIGLLTIKDFFDD